MNHIKLFESFNSVRSFYYHFSNVNLNQGDLIKSSICDDPVYLNEVMPVYRDVAKSHGFNWPVIHGYCFDSPNFIFTTGQSPEDFRRQYLDGFMCYEVVAEDDVHEGAIDRSAQYSTMLLKSGSISIDMINIYANQYFMNPPTTYKECICSSFRIVEKMKDNEWKAEMFTYTKK